ncbi:hypothetical protein P3X46_011494 [Hevea brasiliensis]|uniref:Uncharacterized protein n=1 Tax=Hevea brasiliensis TaxID=3981 RepID=A0ABQ9MB49_HEVBR|nr:uncharacterized protein LOC110638175 [Hevea brasiliensis]KAJ9176151.1 hypothetical protein P3X46_011494 [Hevea brasiliensis]
MKLKNKGKVYPSPSSSSSSSVAASKDRDRDVLSVLKLLPAAILALASVLALEDREVLAYMITRSLKTTTNPNPNNPSSLDQDSKRKSSKKPPNASTNNLNTNNHKPPIFDCDCFDCYTSYWFRWDSSPNRELIHQVIEAFEEHLTNGEQSRKSSKGKRRDRVGRRVGEKPVLDVIDRPEILELESTPPQKANESSIISPDDDVSQIATPERAADGEGKEQKEAERNEEQSESVPTAETEEMAVVSSPQQAVSNHKGLARKVLPDVLGLLNSRLWSLWGPSV